MLSTDAHQLEEEYIGQSLAVFYLLPEGRLLGRAALPYRSLVIVHYAQLIHLQLPNRVYVHIQSFLDFLLFDIQIVEACSATSDGILPPIFENIVFVLIRCIENVGWLGLQTPTKMSCAHGHC